MLVNFLLSDYLSLEFKSILNTAKSSSEQLHFAWDYSWNEAEI